MHGEGWTIMACWLTLPARGGVYELGRLQYDRGGTSCHVAPCSSARSSTTLQAGRHWQIRRGRFPI
jgi:hypothetical protein